MSIEIIKKEVESIIDALVIITARVNKVRVMCEDFKNYITEEQEIKEAYPDTPKDSIENIVYEPMGNCTTERNGKMCGTPITWKIKVDGKYPTHLNNDGTIMGKGRCPLYL